MPFSHCFVPLLCSLFFFPCSPVSVCFLFPWCLATGTNPVAFRSHFSLYCDSFFSPVPIKCLHLCLPLLIYIFFLSGLTCSSLSGHQLCIWPASVTLLVHQFLYLMLGNHLFCSGLCSLPCYLCDIWFYSVMCFWIRCFWHLPGFWTSCVLNCCLSIGLHTYLSFDIKICHLSLQPWVLFLSVPHSWHKCYGALKCKDYV